MSGIVQLHSGIRGDTVGDTDGVWDTGARSVSPRGADDDEQALLPLDELGQIDPRHAGATAYMLANGQGKARAGRAGEARASVHWRVLFLSSGEKGMGDLMAEAGHRQQAGQEVHVIDIPADAGKGAGLIDFVPEGFAASGFAESIKTSAFTHYGLALPAFIEAPRMSRVTVRR